MAIKKTTGISSTTIRFAKGVGAARALPKAKGKRPAVIILHERYGGTALISTQKISQ
jgi:dienelactone hydrolase